MSIKLNRKLLLLIDDKDVNEIKEVLKSPLGLSYKLIENFIENRLDKLKDNLDNIKKFTAGIASAENKQEDYIISKMYPYYFAFHQFVHSSFRARQGKVLEEIIKNILKKEKDIKILDKKQQDGFFNTEDKHLPDYDLFLKKGNELIIIQIRSRDDTGGTTAKTSLVEGIKYIERYLKDNNIKKIEYIVFVWEGLESQQQSTTLEKFYDYLQDKTNIDKSVFFKEILNNGVKFNLNNRQLNLYLRYGKDDFIKLLSKLSLSNTLSSKLSKIISLILDWDDFWMSYQYIGLEYERLKESNFSYIFYIIEKFKKDLKKEINKCKTMEDYINFAKKIADELLKDNIDMPFKNGNYNFIYFVDLILLIIIYYKKKILINDYLIIPKYISFRTIYSNLSTKHSTHKIYYYPAAFIPHVIRFILENYTKPGDVVLDPFAGGGTVGIESSLFNRKSILIDINPLLKDIVDIKTFNYKIDIKKLQKDINYITDTNNNNYYLPNWKNINHWYDEKVLTILSKLWGNFYNNNLNYPLIIKFALLYMSRFFSFSYDGIPKLYKSKTKIQKIEKIIKENSTLKELIKNKFIERVFFIKNSIKELRNMNNNVLIKPKTIIKDTVEYSFEFLKDNMEIDCILTSPPYLQAQEYVRSIKLDLYWYGYNDKQIRELSKLEIPYRKLPDNYKIESKLLEKFKQKIRFEEIPLKDRKIFDSYFYYIFNTINNYSKNLKKNGKLCIFVGSPTFKGHNVSIWEFLMEYFLEKGFVIEEVFADPIVSRKLANNRKNNNPNGMKYEYLIILNKI